MRGRPGPRLPRGAAPAWLAAMSLGLLIAEPAGAQDWATFDSRGLPRSQGVVIRVPHPAAWQRVPPDDELALAELRGPHAGLTGIVQIARGRRHTDIAPLCRPERARTMLADLEAQAPGTRVTDVVAHVHQGRPGFELRYERADDRQVLRVHTRIVCLRDSRLVVSCAATADLRQRHRLAELEPVCARVLGGVEVSENEAAPAPSDPAANE